MSFTQTNICLTKVGPFLRGSNVRPRDQFSLSQSSYLHASSICASATHKFKNDKALPRVVSSSKYNRCAAVRAFGGKGTSDGGKEEFSWDSLKKAMGSVGKQDSVEDLLRKEMQKREFDGDGGGIDPPGSSGDGSGGPEDDDFSGIMEELLQVILATFGVIFVYIYLIRGEELIRLARDYIKYLFGAQISMRLRSAMYSWRKFKESITWKEPREYWLERAIVATPTMWEKQDKLVEWMKSSDEDEDDDS